MDRPATRPMVHSALVVLVATALLLVAARASDAQQAAPPQSSAELTRVVGRVEVLRKGQAQWVAAVIGARLTEGDDIRAFSGALAELTLPDTSTIVLAENSRLLVSKLSVDPQNQSRTVLVHLAVGKVRAFIAQAANIVEHGVQVDRVDAHVEFLRRFVGVRHEAGSVMARLGNRSLDGAGSVEQPETAVTEPAAIGI